MYKVALLLISIIMYYTSNVRISPIGHIRVSRRALLANPFRRPKEDGQSEGSATAVETAILDHVKDTMKNNNDIKRKEDHVKNKKRKKQKDIL